MPETLDMVIEAKNATGKGWAEVENEAKARALRIGTTTEALIERARLAGGQGSRPQPAGSANTLESLLSRAKSTDTQRKNDEVLTGLKDSLSVQQAEYRKHVEEVERLWGSGGRTSREAFNREFTGSNFRSALIRAMRGDFSGVFASIEDAASGAGARIAGALTAGFAGFKLGRMIDDKFGISDRIAGIATSAEDATGKIIEINRRNFRKQNEARWADESKANDEAGFQRKRAEIRARMGLIGASPQQRLDYEIEKANRMQGEASGLTGTALQEKTLEIDQQWLAVKQAALDVEREQKGLIEDSNRARQEKVQLEQQALELAKEEARVRAKEAIDGKIKGMEAAGDAAKAKNGAAVAAIDGKIAGLEAIIQANAGAADNAMRFATDPDAWRDEKKAQKDADREKKRRDHNLNEWAKMEAKGIKLPARAKEALDEADKANAAAKAAALRDKFLKDRDALMASAAQAQIDMQKDIAALRKQMAGLLVAH